MKKIDYRIRFNYEFKENNIPIVFEHLSNLLPNEISIKIILYLLPDFSDAKNMIYEKLNSSFLHINKKRKV